MRKCDVLFGDNYVYSTEDSFLEIFDCIDENGILYIQNFPKDGMDAEGYIVCDMEYTPSSKDDALCEIKGIISGIESLAKIADKECDFSFSDFDSLTDDMKKIYNTYVRELDEGEENFEKMLEIKEKIFNDPYCMTLTKEEKEILSKSRDYEEKDAKSRIGDNFLASATIRYAQRLFRLITLGAPKCICDNEKFSLLKAFIIHKFATSLKYEVE